MKDLQSKRKQRKESKKKKMAALVTVSQLNEYDRAHPAHKPAPDEPQTVPEPSPKKIKIADNTEECASLPPLIGDFGRPGKPPVSGADFVELKRMLRERTTKIRNQPVFRLRDMGEGASLRVDPDSRTPLFVSDLQHLVMYSQVGVHSPYSPARWCALDKFNRLKSTNVLVVENVGLYDFAANESRFPTLNNFPNQVEVVSSHGYGSELVKDLSMVPLTSSQMRRFVDSFGSIESAVSKSDEVYDVLRNIFPIATPEETAPTAKNDGSLPSTDKFSRTKLMLSGWQMVEENFPMPVRGLMERKYVGYVLTKDRYEDVTPYSPMFALDCEMCRTSTGESELTRVSIVDEQHRIFYDTLVKPDNKIIDYLTQFSGITAKMMKPVTTKLADVQREIRQRLPADAIIVGQSLSNDFHALKMMHPYIIDTSVIFNMTGDRSRKTKLQTLTREFLRERIQESRSGHCSTEDSLACIKLVQLKLKHNVFFGDAVIGSISDVRTYPDLATHKYATSMLKQCTKGDNRAFVTALDEIATKYKYYCFKESEAESGNKGITCAVDTTNDKVVERFCQNLGNNQFNLGHIRIPDEELEQEEVKSQTFHRVDQWVKMLVDASAAAKPALNVVLLGGQREGGNGCCFLFLQRDYVR